MSDSVSTAIVNADHAKIASQVYANNLTPCSEFSLIKEWGDYGQTGKGFFRTTSFLLLFVKWPLKFAEFLGLSDRSVELLSSIKDVFGTAKKVSSIGKFFGTIRDLSSDIEGKVKSIIPNTITLITDTIRMTQIVELFKGVILPMSVKIGMAATAEVTTIARDIIDINQFSSNAYEASLREGIASDDTVKTFYSETKKLALIKLTKAVASFVCAIFISIALLAGLPLAGSLTLLSLSTIGTSVAIAAHFYQKNMTYKMKESAV
jgi:hypothetical protein